MKRIINSNKITAFVSLAYLFTWVIWLIGIFVYEDPKVEDIWFYILIGSFGPTFAASVMSFFENGFTGVKQLFAAIFRFKFPIQYWLATLFLLPAVWAIVFFAFGREATDPDVTGLAYITILISPLNALLGIFSGIGPIGEEIGWRGYLLEKMLQKFSVVKTNTILGLIWAFWHLPLIIFLPEFRDDISIGLFLLLYPLLAILLTTMMTNFWKWTNGSIFIAIWVHSLVNELLTYGGNGIWLEDYSTIQLNLISLVIFGLVALISSLVFRKKGESH